MGTYQITAPDGRKFKITGDSPEGAMQALQQHLSTGNQSSDQGKVSINEAVSNFVGDKPLAPAETIDPNQAAYDNLPAWAKPIVAADDLSNVLINGVTQGFGDKARAGFDALVGRGTYDERLKKWRASTDASRKRAGLPGMVTEIAGSVAPVAKLAQAGGTATRFAGKYLGTAIDGGAFGAVNAAGNDQNIGTGAALGAVLGPAGLAVGDTLSTLARPITSRLFPDAAAGRVVAGAMDEAKLTPNQVADDLARAQADGQGSVYSVADALGYPGQRLVSTVVRTPNEGRAPMVDFLEKRQAGQGRRIATALDEGFGNTSTALKAVENLKKTRSQTGDVNYTAARDAATNVDTTPVLSKIDEMLGKPALGLKDGVAPDTVAGALMRARSMLAGSGGAQRMDFKSLLQIRSDLGDMAESSFRSGANARGSQLKAVVRELDAALAQSSAGYRNALEQYAKDSRTIDAVDIGKNAARTGRTEDTIPAFQQMPQEQQAAFRAGYADPLIQQTQGAASGSNKARPLINDAYGAEFPAFAAPGQADKLGRRIAREQTMFETRAAGLGGSKTADNLADEAAMSIIDPSVLGNLLSGNIAGAAKNAVLQTISTLKGQPASVRAKLSEALRMTDPVATRQQLARVIDQMKISDAKKQAVIRALMMASTAGLIQQSN